MGKGNRRTIALSIQDRITDYLSYANDCSKPLSEILEKVQGIVDQADLNNCVNILTFDEMAMKKNIAVSEIIDVYGNENNTLEERE